MKGRANRRIKGLDKEEEMQKRKDKGEKSHTKREKDGKRNETEYKAGIYCSVQ